MLHRKRKAIRFLPTLPGATLLAAGILLLFPLPSPADSFRGMSPREILDHIDDLYRGESSIGTMTMAIVTAHWTRTLTMEFRSKGKDRSLIRIVSPKKEKGTSTLRCGRDIWNYLPKVDRLIKLPSSMMASSWMGSHITNDDLVKESRMAEDYSVEITFEGTRDGEEVVELTCIPLPDAPIVWGKLVCLARVEDGMPLRFEYYDEDIELAREWTFYDFREMGDRLLPAAMKVVPADKPKESTIVTYSEIEYDIPLNDNDFSIRALRR